MIGFARLAVLAFHANHIGSRQRHFGVRVPVLAHPAIVDISCSNSGCRRPARRRRRDRPSCNSWPREAPPETQPPPEPPVKIPSRFASRRAHKKHSSSFTCTTSSSTLKSRSRAEYPRRFPRPHRYGPCRVARSCSTRRRASRYGSTPMTCMFGVLFLQETPHAGGRAARSQAADEVRDFSFGVLPDFRAGGAVVRFWIAGIFVLIGIKRIGNLARQFFGHRIVAARVFRLDRRRADDHFGAKGLQQSRFFRATACR